MSKILNYFESIKWILHLKRLGAFVVNYFVLIIPHLVLSVAIYIYIYINGGFSQFNDNGFSLISVILVVFFQFRYALIYFETLQPLSHYLYELYIFLIVFIPYFLLNTLAGLIIRNDIGSLPFGLIIVDKSGRRAARWRIIIRTFLKYLTVFLCPILLLFPLFNRRQACLHELLSGAYKVEKTVTYYPPVQTQEQ